MNLLSRHRAGNLITVVILAGASLLLVGNMAVGQTGGKKLPMPDKKALDGATALIEELFQSDRVAAKKNADARLKLSQYFLSVAKDTRDDPAGKYLLLRESAQLAADAGDSGTALQALEELAICFDISSGTVFSLRVPLLEAASKSASTPESQRNVLDAALALAEDAFADSDYESAVAYAQIAEQAERKLKSVPLVSALRKRNEEIKAAQAEHATINPFVETLRKNPADPKANYEVGFYFAVVKGNFDKGLPLLAKGDGKALKELAALDLSHPQNYGALADLAAKWVKQAGESKGQAAVHVLQRAYNLYRHAQGVANATAAQQAEAESAMQAINGKLPADQRMGEIAVMERSLSGHRGPVFGVAISHDGTKIASAGADGTVRLWDAKSGAELRRFTGHNGLVWTVRLSPDGRRILTGGADASLRLWDPITGRESKRLTGHNDYVRSVAYSADGHLILSSADDRLVKLWNAETGMAVATFAGHDHFVFSVAISPDGKRGLSGSLDRTIRLWDLENGKPLRTLSGHTDTVLAVAFTPDGQRALSASTDKTLRLWDLNSGKTLHVFEGHTGYVQAVAISSDGSRAISGGQDGKVILWDIDRGKQLRTLTGHNGPVWSVAFSSDGRLAASGGDDGTVRVWGIGK